MPVFTAEIATAQETTMPSAVDSPFSLSGPHALALTVCPALPRYGRLDTSKSSRASWAGTPEGPSAYQKPTVAMSSERVR